MNGRPMNALEYYAQIAQQQQQVPAGNPIEEYFMQQARDARRISGPAAMLSAVTGPAALYSAPNPAMSLPLGALAAAGLMVNGYYEDTAKDADRGADMWANRFGSGDPNQGLPGTQSGPAYRR